MHFLNQLLLLIIIELHVPLGQARLACPVLDEDEADLRQAGEELREAGTWLRDGPQGLPAGLLQVPETPLSPSDCPSPGFSPSDIISKPLLHPPTMFPKMPQFNRDEGLCTVLGKFPRPCASQAGTPLLSCISSSSLGEGRHYQATCYKPCSMLAK